MNYKHGCERCNHKPLLTRIKYTYWCSKKKRSEKNKEDGEDGEVAREEAEARRGSW